MSTRRTPSAERYQHRLTQSFARLVRGERAYAAVLRGWRRGVVGEQLLNVLEGRSRLRIAENRLAVE